MQATLPIRIYDTREEWLGAMADEFAKLFFNGSFAPELPKCRYSCGWPKGKAKAIGQCFAAEVSADHTYEIFISPELDDPLRVADVLLHECIHAAVGLKCGHRGQFRQIALTCGLTGPMKCTVAGDDLKERIRELLETTGSYPHAQLVAGKTPKRQCNRHIKLTCNKCGMPIRATRSWLDTIGPPFCRCGGEFEEKESL